MLNYILRRLLLLPVTLLGTTLVVFGVMAASPGGVGGSELNDEGALKGREAEAAAEYRVHRYGLDRPLAVQYWRWVDQFLPVGSTYGPDGAATFHWLKWPDLGDSMSKGRPITALVAERLPVTLLLSLISLPISHGIAIATGISAARRRGGVVDVGFGLPVHGPVVDPHHPGRRADDRLSGQPSIPAAVPNQRPARHRG